jgi:hypothetical protein
MRNDAGTSVRRDTIPLLVAAGEGRLSVRAFMEGGQRVLEVSGQGLDPVRLFLDDKMMIVKQQFSASGPNGRSMQQEESFGDYRTIGGIRVPFEAAVMHEGRPIVKRTLTKITFNETVDPALFERPQDTPRRPQTSRPPAGR